MSETGIAPRIVLDAPLPRPSLHRLLASPSAATPLPDQAHWQAGASIYPYPDAMPDSIDPCASGTFREKLNPEGVVLPDPFHAFVAYLGEICHSAGIISWDLFRARADAAMDARTSWALERQLAWGQWQATNPFLADADMQIPAGSAAVPAAVALAYLEEFLATRGQGGVIHMTAPVAAYLGFTHLYVDGQQLRVLGTGTPVIVGQGYTDADAPSPDVSPAVDATDPGQSWIFASGQIVYRQGDVISLPETLSQALDRENNDVVYRAERDLWVAFDGGPHAGVLADWSP